MDVDPQASCEAFALLSPRLCASLHLLQISGKLGRSLCVLLRAASASPTWRPVHRVAARWRTVRMPKAASRCWRYRRKNKLIILVHSHKPAHKDMNSHRSVWMCFTASTSLCHGSFFMHCRKGTITVVDRCQQVFKQRGGPLESCP